MKLIKPFFLVALGVFIIYWTQNHSPKVGLGKIISNELSGSYTMSEPWYYISLVLGTTTLVVGIIKTYKLLK